jgi:glycosyltransferase involved in cell wall biosynthesis
MKTILIYIGCYFPGYKGGGPIRSIANLVDKLGDDYRFKIITSDRDKGDRIPYPGLRAPEWRSVGKADVLYLSPSERSLWKWRRLLTTLDYDVIYLNSYFAYISISVLILRLLKLIPMRPVLIAPRGEFSKGAIKIKSSKKRLYISFANWVGLNKQLRWHASSEYEALDIQREINDRALDIRIAGNIIGASLSNTPRPPIREKSPGHLNIIYLGRITRKKNLEYALKILATVKGQIRFNIYGPMEDKKYWLECEYLASHLSQDIKAGYCGALHPDRIGQIFSEHHVFLFPTLGENFGHVIIEALAAGCPVIISDQTMWRNLKEKKAGWDLPLSDIEGFRDALRKCIMMDTTEYSIWSNSAIEYARAYDQKQEREASESYRCLFRWA